MPRKNQKFLVQIMKFLPKNFKLILCGPLVSKGSKKIEILNILMKLKTTLKNIN